MVALGMKDWVTGSIEHGSRKSVLRLLDLAQKFGNYQPCHYLWRNSLYGIKYVTQTGSHLIG